MSDLGIDIPVTSFKLHAKKFLLTYKSHINKENLLEYISTIYDLKEFGICHETSEEGYEHTHFLVHTVKQPCITDARKFDYNEIHPNIKKLLTNTHYSNVFNYLHKQDNNVYTNITDSTLDKNIETQKTIELIEKCNSWGDVLRHPDLCHKIRWCRSWAMDIFYSKPKKPPKCNITYRNLLVWQKDIYNKLKKPPIEREIIWCYSPTAKQGKSTFIKYLQSKMTVFCAKKLRNLDDIGYSYNQENVIVIDLPMGKSKTLESNLQNHFQADYPQSFNDNLLSIIETLSDKGSYNCGKYEGKYVIFDCHILVMSNCCPEYVDKYLPNRLYSVEAKL